MTIIADLSAAELTDAYRRGRLSPVEVARDVLARVEANAKFNAFRPFDAKAALAAASDSEKRWRAGAPLGAADGVPATIKDNIWLKGHPTGRGSKTGDHSPAQADAPACARLREQGAVFVGKTTLPEYGWIGVCHSPLTGITRNPWNAEHTPGGSTGGGAVAALLNLGVLHLGTDGAGSLRIPAAFAGVFGFKPSFGRVPAYPASPFSVLAHQGPIARRVADAALMLSVISGPDARDMSAWNTPAEDFTTGLDAGVRGLRVAFSARPGPAAVPAPEIEAAARKAANVLEEQGASVEEADPPLDRALEIIRGMWWPVVAAIVDAVPATQRGDMDAGLAPQCRSRPPRLAEGLSCRLFRARRALQCHAPLPRALRLAGDADHAGDRAEGGKGNAGDGRLRRRLAQLVALHLPLQLDPAAGRLAAERPCRQRPADGRADRRPAARRSTGAARGSGD